MNAVERILELISAKGITEQKFLSDLHFNRSLLSDWKSGKSKSYRKHIDKIADYFGVTTDYLLTGKKQENIRVYDEDDNVVVLDDETLEIIDSLRKRPEMKILFSVSKKATKEDIIKAVKIIEALRDTKEGD